jgi:hypothetical protein
MEEQMGDGPEHAPQQRLPDYWNPEDERIQLANEVHRLSPLFHHKEKARFCEVDPDSEAILPSRPEDAKTYTGVESRSTKLESPNMGWLFVIRYSCLLRISVFGFGIPGAGEQNRISQDTENPPCGIKKQIQSARLPAWNKALVDFVQEAVSQDDGRGKKEGSKREPTVHLRGDHPCGEQAQSEELSEVEEEIRQTNGELRGEVERRGMEDGSHQKQSG